MTKTTRNGIEQETFANVLQHLCRRPRMFTFDGSFRQVVAYIEGYIRGAGFPQGQINLESGMGPFGRWLAEKYGHRQDQSWCQVLLDHCGGDEEQALHNLWPLYLEYTRSHGDESV